MDNVLQYPNVTSAIAAEGIEDTFDLFTLTDNIVDKLSYPDPDPNVKTNHRLKKGKIGLLNHSSTTSIIAMNLETLLVINGQLSPWLTLINSDLALLILLG
jgi:hypothetical protein